VRLQESKTYQFIKKVFYTGSSKMYRCKACEVMRNEAYILYAAVTYDKCNAALRRSSGP